MEKPNIFSQVFSAAQMARFAELGDQQTFNPVVVARLVSADRSASWYVTEIFEQDDRCRAYARYSKGDRWVWLPLHGLRRLALDPSFGERRFADL